VRRLNSLLELDANGNYGFVYHLFLITWVRRQYGRKGWRPLGVLVQSIKADEATGLLASRYAPERYQEFRLEREPIGSGWNAGKCCRRTPGCGGYRSWLDCGRESAFRLSLVANLSAMDCGLSRGGSVNSW